VKITINIPDPISQRVIDGIAYQHSYKDQVHDPETGTDIDNPETKGQYTKRMLILWAKDNVKSWEANQATDAARQTAIDSADSDITIT